MRLLFDEQLSNRLPRLLADHYPGSLHVEALDLCGAPDIILWQAAVVHDCVLVSKDEDFHRLSVIRGTPPKVVWLRVGNCTTQEIVDLLRKHVEDIRRFSTQDEVSFLEPIRALRGNTEVDQKPRQALPEPRSPGIWMRRHHPQPSETSRSPQSASGRLVAAIVRIVLHSDLPHIESLDF